MMEIHKKAEKIYDNIYGKDYLKEEPNRQKEIKDAWIRGYVQGWTDGDMNGYRDAQKENREYDDS